MQNDESEGLRAQVEDTVKWASTGLAGGGGAGAGLRGWWDPRPGSRFQTSCQFRDILVGAGSLEGHELWNQGWVGPLTCPSLCFPSVG